MKFIFAALTMIVLSACAANQGSNGWLNPAHERLYTSQNYYKSTGRADIHCYLPDIKSGPDDVICVKMEHVPAGVITTPVRAASITNTYSGGPVYVKGYYRKDGTYVRPHTRRAPRRR